MPVSLHASALRRPTADVGGEPDSGCKSRRSATPPSMLKRPVLILSPTNRVPAAGLRRSSVAGQRSGKTPEGVAQDCWRVCGRNAAHFRGAGEKLPPNGPKELQDVCVIEHVLFFFDRKTPRASLRPQDFGNYLSKISGMCLTSPHRLLT